MGHDLETQQYRISMLCALRRVSVYSRSYIVQWELLQLGLATLGTALALYYLMVCLSLLVVQEILLSTLVLLMVCTCLSVTLTPWKVGVGLILGVIPSSIKFSVLGVIQTVCSPHHVQSTDNSNGHVHEQSSYLPLQDSLLQRSSVTCTLPSPAMNTDKEMNKLCTGGWDHLQLWLTTLGRVYLLVYLSLLLLQAGDVERNPGPTPGK